MKISLRTVHTRPKQVLFFISINYNRNNSMALIQPQRTCFESARVPTTLLNSQLSNTLPGSFRVCRSRTVQIARRSLLCSRVTHALVALLHWDWIKWCGGLSGVVNAHHVRSMPPFVRLITSDAHALPPDRAWTDGAAQTKKKKANRSVLRPGASGNEVHTATDKAGELSCLPTRQTTTTIR